MKRLLCVWLPNWPIQRLRLAGSVDGALSRQNATTPSRSILDRETDAPVLLWKDDPRRGRLVVACCSAARQRGVKESMPISQAAEMVASGSSTTHDRSGRTPPWIAQHDPELDQFWLEQLAGRLQQKITPLVALETLDDQPWAGHRRHQSESLLCDITGAAHLFGDETGLLNATERLLSAMGLYSQMAITDCVGAAWALSHYSPGRSRSTILPPGSPPDCIASLPVESLRISAATAATLSRLGVEQVGQLLQLPRSGLATRLGIGLVRRIEQALGELDEPLAVYRAPAEHSAGCELEYPTDDQRIIADRIGRLTKAVRAGLATRQRGALSVACRLDLSAHPPLTLEIGLFAPTIDSGHLSALILHQLENKKLLSPVTNLHLSVTLSGPLRSKQASLLDDENCDWSATAGGSAISRLVDSLSGRLGRHAVVGVNIEDDPLPEKAFSVFPLAGNRLTSSRGRRGRGHAIAGALADPPSPDDPMRRPLFLLPQPITLAVALDNSSFDWNVSSPLLPSRIRLHGVVHRVVAHWGPERIETGWWKDSCVRRDYYRIETCRGRWWWIFRNLLPKSQASDPKRYRWMLHGRFA